MLGKTEQEEKGVTEDEMVGWHYCLSGHEFEQTRVFLPGKSHGQRNLTVYSPWGCRVSHNISYMHART